MEKLFEFYLHLDLVVVVVSPEAVVSTAVVSAAVSEVSAELVWLAVVTAVVAASVVLPW